MIVFGVHYRNNSGSDDASDASLGPQDENEDLPSESSEDYTADNSSSESENEEYAEIFSDNEDDFNDQPLYRGSPLTVMESMLLILTILLHHNVTMTCLSDIIAVINFHCLNQGLKRNSLYKFRKYFGLGENNNLKKHYYCTICLRALVSTDEICPSCPKKKNGYFVQLPFLEQLKEMYKRRDFYNNLQHRFHRPMHQPHTISDIYDGTLYQAWMDNGFLSDSSNISLSWYTDGVPVFKSSKISVWPIYLSINELPFEIRKKRENTMLAGLWHGDTKPDMNRFFHSLRSDLQKLSNGIRIFVPSLDETLNVRGVLLTGTCDTPARCECLNFTNFNGKYGCSFCLIEGVNVPLEPKGHVFAFPYQNELSIRTSENTQRFAPTASADNPVMGVKGPTVFSQLMPDLILGMGLDRMHGVEGGVVKKVLNLLFNVEYRAQPFSLYAFIDVINSRLTSIKPPKFVHRMPRSITELIHWKASELKMWFFYYSIPVLQGILREDYFRHYLLLVIGIALLSSDVITPQMLQISRDFLNTYVKQFQTLYGLRFCSINIHQILHYPDIVERLGPLWVYTCFEYEDLNGQLLRLVHGTNHIDTQIVNSQNQFIAMIKLMETLPNGELKSFCQKKKHQVKINEQILEHCYSVGVYKLTIQMSELIQRAMQNIQILRNFRVWTFSRLLKNGTLYVANTYKDNLQTCSSVAEYVHNHEFKLGAIHCFVKVHNCDCEIQNCECEKLYFAILQNEMICRNVFETQGNFFYHNSLSFLQQCEIVENVIAIPITTLISVCIYMNVDNSVYIGLPINRKELE